MLWSLFQQQQQAKGKKSPPISHFLSHLSLRQCPLLFCGDDIISYCGGGGGGGGDLQCSSPSSAAAAAAAEAYLLTLVLFCFHFISFFASLSFTFYPSSSCPSMQICSAPIALVCVFALLCLRCFCLVFSAQFSSVPMCVSVQCASSLSKRISTIV